MPTQNATAPARSNGVVCLLAGDTDAYTATRAQVQHLVALGLPSNRAAIIAPLCFGEAR
jgi:precorrin-4 methylase